MTSIPFTEVSHVPRNGLVVIRGMVLHITHVELLSGKTAIVYFMDSAVDNSETNITLKHKDKLSLYQIYIFVFILNVHQAYDVGQGWSMAKTIVDV